MTDRPGEAAPCLQMQARRLAIRQDGLCQVADYARRKDWSLAEAERWLAPALGH